MKKYNKLVTDYKKLKSQKKCILKVDEVTLFDFLKYKYINKKFNNTKLQIYQLYQMKNQIEKTYDQKTSIWVNSMDISCMKYGKLEKKASYEKNYKLYKLGFISQRPIPPALKKFNPIISKLAHINKRINSTIENKINNFISKTIPQKVNNVNINATKCIIKGYRYFQNDFSSIKKYFSTKSSFQYLRNISNEAKKQLDNEIHYKNRPFTEQELEYRNSLKVSNYSSKISYSTLGASKLKSFSIEKAL